MSDPNEVGISVTADTDGAVQAVDLLNKRFEEFSKSMAEQSKELTEKLTSVGEKFNQVKSQIMAMVAGGSFAEIIKEADEFTEASFKMSEMLGTTTEKATEQVAALKLIGVSAEQYEGLLQRMTLQVRNNEQRLNALGVATRGANNEFLDGQQIMQNALGALQQFKEGTDRNLAATELFGRGWGAVLPLLRLNSEMMARAKQDVEDLGLATTKTGVDDMHRFHTATAEVGLVLQGMGKAIAEYMMPRLEAMALWFREVGPTAIKILEGALKGLGGVIEVLTKMWQSLITYLLATISIITATIEAVGGMAAAIASPHPVDAAKQRWRKFMDELVLITSQTKAQVDDIWDKPLRKGEIHAEGSEGKKGGKSYTGKAKGEESAVQKLKEELMNKHLEDTNLLENTAKSDKSFWESHLHDFKEKSKEWFAVRQQIYTLSKQLAQQGQADAKADEAQQMAEARTSKEEKVKIAGEWAEHQKSIYGEDSTEYKQAIREKTQAEMALHDFKVQLQASEIDSNAKHNTALLAQEMERQKGRLAMGQITEQTFALYEQQNARQTYDIQRKALEDKLALLEKDKLDTKEAKDELLKLDDDYALKQIQNQVKVGEALKKNWDNIFSSISNAFDTSIKGMIMGTTTFQKALANIWQSILGEFINMLIKMGKQWLVNKLAEIQLERLSAAAHLQAETAKTSSTLVGTAARSAAEQAAADEGLAAQAMSAIKTIMNNAATTFSGVFAALSGIPIIGPFLAAAAAPAAALLVAGEASAVTSAAGGYDIPAGINPMVQTHEKEMILPAHLADTIRGMAAGGGGGGAVHVHMHGDVYGMDDFESAVTAAVRKGARTGSKDLAMSSKRR